MWFNEFPTNLIYRLYNNQTNDCNNAKKISKPIIYRMLFLQTHNCVMNKKRIAILASGSGTNAENIASYFKNNEYAEVVLILTNVTTAGVIARAQRLDIPCLVMDKMTVSDGRMMLELIQQHNIDLVVLAGYLKLMPAEVVSNFQHRIINIHPALLPLFGGRGMYGHNVHEAVLQAGVAETGITIHYVNNRFDEGEIIFQKSIPVLPDDTAESIALRIHRLEYEHYPPVIEQLAKGLF